MTTPKTAAERFTDSLVQVQGSRGVARRLLMLTGNPEFNLREAVACLESDPALAAKTLRVVNSSRYGLRHAVASVRQAAALLGQKSLRLFAISFSLTDSLTKGPAAAIAEGFGRRAVTMACAASRLAKLDGGLAADEAYSAGLLADLGVLVLAQYQPKTYLPAYESCAHGPELMSAERELFDIAHPEVGARFLSRWDLPASVVAAVAAHHDDPAMVVAAAAGGEPEETAGGGRLGAALRAADLFATALADPTEPRVRGAAAALRREFGVTEPRKLAEEVLQELAESAELFGVKVPPGNAALEAFEEPVAVAD